MNGLKREKKFKEQKEVNEFNMKSSLHSKRKINHFHSSNEYKKIFQKHYWSQRQWMELLSIAESN